MYHITLEMNLAKFCQQFWHEVVVLNWTLFLASDFLSKISWYTFCVFVSCALREREPLIQFSCFSGFRLNCR